MTDQDIVSWNSIITGYIHQGYEIKALETFSSMLKSSSLLRIDGFKVKLKHINEAINEGTWSVKFKKSSSPTLVGGGKIKSLIRLKSYHWGVPQGVQWVLVV
ncbi:putative pentatricopeptide [Lupinus albus]|uniref:Putative pentatricopeptide n=1 Tax=Lupinus albus TaxID=3870 RepID=A0A6A4QXQ4_LUPAL|nr:putative pentatricopeptide [Lupinus albus]